MKIGLVAGVTLGARPQTLATIALHAERLNYGTVWSGEHVVLFDNYECKYPYTETGEMPLPADADFLDPFIGLTYVAALTKTIRLATGICLVPEHNPVVLAKQAASLDFLSGGRFALGVGIGWSAEEFAAVGVPFERRARRTGEYLEAMRRLWGEERASFNGEFVKFHDVRCYPKPIAGAGLPVYFGGESVPALKRVVRYGTGWYGSNLGPEETKATVNKLRKMLAEAGRNPDEVRIMMSPGVKYFKPDYLPRYRDAGVEEIVIYINYGEKEADIVSKLEHLASRWVEPAAAL